MLINGLALVGAMTTAWFGIRAGATVIDLGQRWWRHRKGDVNAWKVEGE